MRFSDFDIGLRPSSWPDTFFPEGNLRYRAFVRAVRVGLGGRRLQSPWAKLYVLWVPDDADYWQAPIPSANISSAGFILKIPDDELLTAQGEALRPVLARSVARVREHLRSASGWDDEEFWRMVADIGDHRGRYAMERRRVGATDRKAKVTATLHYEWDETGTTVYAIGRAWPARDGVLWRVQLADYPGAWELEFGADFAPAKLQLTPSVVVAVDRNGTTIAEAERPDRG